MSKKTQNVEKTKNVERTKKYRKNIRNLENAQHLRKLYHYKPQIGRFISKKTHTQRDRNMIWRIAFSLFMGPGCIKQDIGMMPINWHS